jgi:hypothetical protein
MKAFLTYMFQDNVSGIVDLLKSHNIEVYDSQTDLKIGSSLQESIRQAVADCDFAFIVCSKPNTNLAFETGLAVALRKPIFVVMAPNMDFQDYLFDSTYVTALPDEINRILFGFELFLRNIQTARLHKIRKTPMYYGGGEPIPLNDFAKEFKEIKWSGKGDYETLVRHILEAYKLTVVQDITTSWDLFADFSIWSDELEPYLNNPILVEVKAVLDPGILQEELLHIGDVRKKTPTSSFLIFYGDLKNLDRKDLPQSLKCLFIDIADLVMNLQTKSFGEAVIQIRNSIAHNIYY